jgi:hypothetical protein
VVTEPLRVQALASAASATDNAVATTKVISRFFIVLFSSYDGGPAGWQERDDEHPARVSLPFDRRNAVCSIL